MVRAWVDAQNRGDLARYQALYAARFFGVRRSGPRVVRLDRAGWMKDRARMFQRPMTVIIDHLTMLATGERTAIARFTQDWSSGSYHDTGENGQLTAEASFEIRSYDCPC
jgi:hypothetical protein